MDIRFRFFLCLLFGGHQLALEIRKKHEVQKIVFLTGKADYGHYKFSTSQLCGTLEKPYSFDELIALLSSLVACEDACEYSAQRNNVALVSTVLAPSIAPGNQIIVTASVTHGFAYNPRHTIERKSFIWRLCICLEALYDYPKQTCSQC